jgi:hypothetical protein
MKRFGSSPTIHTRDTAAAERNTSMRHLVLALSLFATGILSAAGSALSQTYDPDYPVCLHVYGQVAYYSCRYVSIAQCAPSAAGRSAECIVNPYYAGAQREVPPRRYRYRRQGS